MNRSRVAVDASTASRSMTPDRARQALGQAWLKGDAAVADVWTRYLGARPPCWQPS